MTIFGTFGQLMVILRNFGTWGNFENFGNLWAICGQFVAIHGNLWRFMVIFQLLRVFDNS